MSTGTVALRRRHQPEIVQHRTWSTPRTLCQVCGQRWPCETIILLDRLDALLTAGDAIVAALDGAYFEYRDREERVRTAVGRYETARSAALAGTADGEGE